MTTITIQNYMKNLIAGLTTIAGLYDAVINARRICAKGGRFEFTFTLNGFGSQRYSARQLINFDNEALCNSVTTIIGDSIILSLDQMVLILLKGRSEIRGLYGSIFRAKNAITDAKILCYTFNNPYGIFSNVDKNSIRLSANQVITLFNNVGTFNPLIIITLI